MLQQQQETGIDLLVLLWLNKLVLLPILAGVIGACSNHAPHKEFWTLKFPNLKTCNQAPEFEKTNFGSVGILLATLPKELKTNDNAAYMWLIKQNKNMKGCHWH